MTLSNNQKQRLKEARTTLYLYELLKCIDANRRVPLFAPALGQVLWVPRHTLKK